LPLPALPPLLSVVAVVSSVVWLDTDEFEESEFLLIFLCNWRVDGGGRLVMEDEEGGGLPFLRDWRIERGFKSIAPLLMDLLFLRCSTLLLFVIQ